MIYKFVFAFSITIKRVAGDFEFEDSKLLDTFQRGTHSVQKLSFRTEGEDTKVEGIAIFEGNKAWTGYMYIDDHIPAMLSKALCIHSGVDNYEMKVDQNKLVNRAELLKEGIEAQSLEQMYKKATMRKKRFKLDKGVFSNSMERVKSFDQDSEVDNILFFMHLSNTVNRSEDTFTQHDIISRFRLIWSAFNALYKYFTPEEGDQKSVIAFSQQPETVKFINSPECREHLQILKSANLILKPSGKKVSEDLKKALDSDEREEISKNALLCIYAVRNFNFHGTNNEANAFCRTCYELINSLLKYYLLLLNIKTV